MECPEITEAKAIIDEDIEDWILVADDDEPSIKTANPY